MADNPIILFNCLHHPRITASHRTLSIRSMLHAPRAVGVHGTSTSAAIYRRVSSGDCMLARDALDILQAVKRPDRSDSVTVEDNIWLWEAAQLCVWDRGGQSGRERAVMGRCTA